MSNTLNISIATVPSITATAVAYITNASPIEYGIVGVVLTVGLIPIVKWMMNRMDFAQRQEAAISKSREDRSDQQLVQLTKIAQNQETFSIQAMNILRDIQLKLSEAIKK